MGPCPVSNEPADGDGRCERVERLELDEHVEVPDGTQRAGARLPQR